MWISAKKKLTSAKEEAQVEAKVLHLLERYLMIEDLLALSSVEWDRPREAPFPVVNDISEADRATTGGLDRSATRCLRRRAAARCRRVP